MAGGFLLITLVHVWGLIRRTQPWTEDTEAVLYAGLTALAFWVRASLP